MALDPRFLTPVSGFRIAGVPTAVAASRDKVLVGNSTSGRVEVFDYYGHYHFSMGQGRLQKPTGIAIDTIAQTIFVLDGGTREVHAFDYSGRHLERVVGPGSSPNTLAMPSGITVDARRAELLVTDYGLPNAAAVKRFGYGGQDLGTVSGDQLCGGGSCSDGFSRPTGVSVDRFGRLLITDAILGQILVLDRESGEFLLRVGSREDSQSPLRLPMDVLVGRDGAVYVASSRTSAVVRFDSMEFPR
jgi:DNA-binding beta-propeller fold protein YncE